MLWVVSAGFANNVDGFKNSGWFRLVLPFSMYQKRGLFIKIRKTTISRKKI